MAVGEGIIKGIEHAAQHEGSHFISDLAHNQPEFIVLLVIGAVVWCVSWAGLKVWKNRKTAADQ